MTIADEVKQMLASVGDDGRLRALVDAQTAIVVAKYGQTFDDNVKESRAKAVHIVQELIDAMQYSVWLKNDYTSEYIFNYLKTDLDIWARTAQMLVSEFNLTLEELTFKESHSASGAA
jgi:hypothetical protein